MKKILLTWFCWTVFTVLAEFRACGIQIFEIKNRSCRFNVSYFHGASKKISWLKLFKQTSKSYNFKLLVVSRIIERKILILNTFRNLNDLWWDLTWVSYISFFNLICNTVQDQSFGPINNIQIRPFDGL